MSASAALFTIVLLPTLNGIAGMVQFDDPRATPDAPLLVVQATCTAPVPPETVPLIEMGDEVVELGGVITASSKGFDGVGVGEGGAGGGLAAVSAAAYNSCAAAMSLGIKTVCKR